MLNKKKGDRVPLEDIADTGEYDRISIENWLNNRELWNKYNGIMVHRKDFVVDREDRCLYVVASASGVTRNKWGGGGGSHVNIQLWRVHDGWLRADYPETMKFQLGDVQNSKAYVKINLLYKLVKVDDVIKESWWNEH